MAKLDYVVLVAYLIGTLVLGLIFARRNRTIRDMFGAGGRSPWWVSGVSSFMTMFSAGTFVIWGGIAYKHGLVAVAINMTYGIAALAAGYLVAGKWNSLGVRTPAEFIELRFGKATVQLYTWTLLLFRVVDVSISLYALAVILAALMPVADLNVLRDPATGHVSVSFLVCLFGSLVIIYTMVGGLWAVLMTDVLQFVILNLSVIFLLLLTFATTPSIAALAQSAPHGSFCP